MYGDDFLGFMANLINVLRLGRNTSLEGSDLRNSIDVLNKEYVFNENNKKILFILDNARIHIKKEVKEKLLKNYNILLLAPYSPYLNIIELWFS